MKNVAILGSTGSIGRSTLEVIDNLKHRYNVTGLAAGRNLSLFKDQIDKFLPEIVSLENEEHAEAIQSQIDTKDICVVFGQEGAEEVASYGKNDIVVSSITGINGLRPTLAAVRSGQRIALANKESMVVAGSLIQKIADDSGAEIIPVDSEHSGVFQCLAKEEIAGVKKVILTASGGPFFNTPREEMKDIAVADALNHPRWNMGDKVSIDSATLMNKGLELIEARWLFGLDPDKLGVLIHPQSIVHSLIEMLDGSILAQLSPTDMKIPIQYALTYPEREEGLLPSLDLSAIGALEFCEVDVEKFPMVDLARQAMKENNSFAIALNAANEVVVAAFLKEKIKFMDIPAVVTKVVEDHRSEEVETVDEIFAVDRETRSRTRKLLEQR
ncbi:MAG: 1-deoxy-D-xylulose-5-phosphate reductoisomerase [Candidatus Aminicenantes bacterium]|jgi:1-deoxy-D-xylulose-5-phosphate reductoisomerase